MDDVAQALYYRRVGWQKKFDRYRRQATESAPECEAALTALEQFDQQQLSAGALVDRLADTAHVDLLTLALRCACIYQLPYLSLLRRCAELGHSESYITYLHTTYSQGQQAPALEAYQQWKNHGQLSALLKLEQSAPHAQLLNETIQLQYWAQILSPMMVDYLRNLSDGQFSPASVIDPATGEAKRDEVRRADVVQLKADSVGLMAVVLQRQLADYVNKPIECCEMMNIIRYRHSQEYRPHYDGFTDKQLAHQADDSQRDTTLISYLAVAEEGGSTVFPKLEQDVAGQVGDAISFVNSDKDGHILPQSLHAGSPIVRGEKVILTQWFREGETDYGRQLKRLLE